VARRRGIFDDLLYAQCWEDPEIDRRAFALGPDDVVLCITSGGCNALAFLLDDPAQVIALDLNAGQNHLLELKMAGFAELGHEELLAFLGVGASVDRIAVYRGLRPRLSPACRAFWDRRTASLRSGVLHAGRYERYLALIRTWIHRLVGRDVVERLCLAEDPVERRRLYERRWDGPRWRMLTDLLLSRRVMTRLFDAAFFAHVEDDEPFGRVFRRRIEHALTELPVATNPFVAYALLGRFPSERSLPVYLRPAHHETIRRRLERVRIVTASCLDHLRTLGEATVSKFDFTNIFEWLSTAETEAILREAARVGTDGAVLAYRNLLVPRSRPPSLAGSIVPRPRLAARLHGQDLSFVYGSYVVEVVRKAGVPCGA